MERERGLYAKMWLVGNKLSIQEADNLFDVSAQSKPYTHTYVCTVIGKVLVRKKFQTHQSLQKLTMEYFQHTHCTM